MVVVYSTLSEVRFNMLMHSDQSRVLNDLEALTLSYSNFRFISAYLCDGCIESKCSTAIE